MAKIIENETGRRLIQMSVDDVINIVREYQNIVYNRFSYTEIRAALSAHNLFVPEEV